VLHVVFSDGSVSENITGNLQLFSFALTLVTVQ